MNLKQMDRDPEKAGIYCFDYKDNKYSHNAYLKKVLYKVNMLKRGNGLLAYLYCKRTR